MHRSALAIFCFCTAALSQGLLDKAPPDVEDALRTRITEFYQLHVDHKYRKAEELVADDSKEVFYSSAKADLSKFRISNIVWSDDFTRAKATIVGTMPISMPGFGGKLTDVPFPSLWKLEDGQWRWYAVKPDSRATPFGVMKLPQTDSAKTPPQIPADIPAQAPDLNALLNAVEPDRTSIRLSPAGGTEEKVKITNKLAGPVTLELPLKRFHGMEVKLDRPVIKGGDTAILTFRSLPGDRHPSGFVRVNVKPTNQTIDIQVSFN